MTSESIAEPQEHAAPRWALPLAVLGWSAGAACVAFMTCYAYHLGI